MRIANKLFEKAWVRKLLSVSVRWKLMGEAVGIVLLLTVAISVQVLSVLRGYLREELKRRGALVAATLAGGLSDSLASDRLEDAQKLVQQRVSLDEDILYVLVVDAEGRVVVKTLREQVPRRLLEQRTAPTGESSLRLLSTPGGSIWDSFAPIRGQPGWVVRVGMSERRLRQTVKATTKQLAGAAAVVSVVALAWAALLNFSVVSPIDELVRATEAVRDGDFNYRAKTWASDELGRLAAEFNRMTEALARSQQALRASNEQLLRRNAELSAVNTILQVASSSLELTHVLDKTLSKVVELLQADAGWIFVCDPRTGELATGTGVNLPDDLWHKLQEQIEKCRADRLKEIAEVWVGTGGNCCPGVECSAIRDAGLIANVGVPLRSRDKTVGILSLLFQADRELTEADLHLLQIIGQHIGVAVENAFLYEQVRRQERARRKRLDEVIQAQEEERKRIARELHDQVAQSLTALLMSVDTVRMSCPQDMARPRELLDQVHNLAEEILDELRRLMMNLRPALLDDLGLIAAVKSYTENKLKPLNIEPKVVVTGKRRRLPAPIDIAVYRIVQEGVNNIAKHSQAKHATITIHYRDDGVGIRIEDDGKGFDPSGGEQKSGLGLLGIQERVGLLGGDFRVDSKPGQGCRISIEIPLAKHEETDDGQISHLVG